MFDLLLTNAKLLIDPRGTPRADSVGVSNGRIAAIGSLDEIAAGAGPATRRVDLGGRTLGPAFADPHIHLWKVGQLEASIADLRDATTWSEVRSRLATQADSLAPGAWLLGRGVNEQRLEEGALPDRQRLDAWFGELPVLVTRVCAHVAVANSAALRLAGVQANTPDPPGGEIRRDARGEPTGFVTETAIALLNEALPKPSEQDYREWIDAAQRRKLSQGCASATDPGVDEPLLQAYRSMDRGAELALRCHVMRLAPESGAVDPATVSPPERGDRLAIDTVKFFLDGGLSGATAAISLDYRQGGRGVLRMSCGDFSQRLAPYAQAGYAVAVHAIGDVAIDAALDAFAETACVRKRIEHLGLPTADALRRASELGVLVATQPAFLPELGPNFNAYLPDDFPITPYPFRSMLDAGLGVAFSSDAPVVVDDSPLGGIAAAVTRAGSPATEACQRVSVAEALHAYTLAAARIEGVEAERGSIEIGKQADLVVLNGNPLSTPIEDLSSLQVEATYVAGEMVYER